MIINPEKDIAQTATSIVVCVETIIVNKRTEQQKNKSGELNYTNFTELYIVCN